ncbi:30S ribosomal protein S2 [Candidatus Vidania fulgoroideorum]
MFITYKNMLKKNIHIGHMNKFFNPNLKKYIYCNYKKINILNIYKTLKNIIKTINFIKKNNIKLFNSLLICSKKKINFFIKKKVRKIFFLEKWKGGNFTNKIMNFKNIKIIFIIDYKYHKIVYNELIKSNIKLIFLSDNIINNLNKNFFIPLNDDSVISILYILKIIFNFLK